MLFQTVAEEPSVQKRKWTNEIEKLHQKIWTGKL